MLLIYLETKKKKKRDFRLLDQRAIGVAFSSTVCWNKKKDEKREKKKVTDAHWTAGQPQTYKKLRYSRRKEKENIKESNYKKENHGQQKKKWQQDHPILRREYFNRNQSTRLTVRTSIAPFSPSLRKTRLSGIEKTCSQISCRIQWPFFLLSTRGKQKKKEMEKMTATNSIVLALTALHSNANLVISWSIMKNTNYMSAATRKRHTRWNFFHLRTYLNIYICICIYLYIYIYMYIYSCNTLLLIAGALISKKKKRPQQLCTKASANHCFFFFSLSFFVH